MNIPLLKPEVTTEYKSTTRTPTKIKESPRTDTLEKLRLVRGIDGQAMQRTNMPNYWPCITARTSSSGTVFTIPCRQCLGSLLTKFMPFTWRWWPSIELNQTSWETYYVYSKTHCQMETKAEAVTVGSYKDCWWRTTPHSNGRRKCPR